MVANNTEMDWYDVACCDACGGSRQERFMESHVPQWYGERPLRLVRCQDCELVFASPRPDLAQLYRFYLVGDDAAQAVVRRKLERPNVLDIHRRHVAKALEFLGSPARRLFDMGCGAGTTLSAARELGLETWGNDVNKAAVDMLCAAGHRVQLGFTSAIDLPGDYFDVVLNFDYLEHSYTPSADLRRCYDMLRPGGVLYLKTLYLDCPAHREKGEGWQLFGIGHFYFFTLDVLRRMVEQAGFEIIDVRAGQLVFVAARRPHAVVPAVP